MKNLIIASIFATGLVAALEAAPTSVVTQADLQAILTRLSKLEAENKVQAARIAELEGKNKLLVAQQTETTKKIEALPIAGVAMDEGTETNETGRIWTLGNGKKYYLADTTAKIFEPLTESGLQLTPYGYLVFEAVYNSAGSTVDWSTDWVDRRSAGAQKTHTTTFSVQDSIFGFNLATPEAMGGWKFTGKAEMDLAGGDANSYDFHWRHLYINAEHVDTGWNILFGQTWHLWKMVSPQEIDGAWLENTGYPYRRSPQIRVTKKWNYGEDSSLEFRAGLVKNGPSMNGDRDGDGYQDNSASCWPLLEAAVLYDHKTFWEDTDRRWLVGLGGQYGRDKSRRWTGGNTYEGDYDEYDSDMIMIAGSLPFLEKFTLTGQFFAGHNLGGVQAGVDQRVAYYELNARGTEVGTIGGFADLRYDLNDTWAFAVGYGFDNPTDSEAQYASGRLFNDRVYGDVFYNVTANLRFALEYAHLTTDYYDEGTSPDNRVQFTAFFDF